MNNTTIPDVQNSQDTRNIDIEQVGIKGIRHPVVISARRGVVQHTVANFSMYVGLPHNFKGTHMSRFVEILNDHEYEITVDSFKDMITETLEKLDAETTFIEMTFPFFISKKAPVSNVASLMDYEVTFIGQVFEGKPQVSVKMIVPVTSLCPCSKGISEYGAHNQRSHVTLTCTVNKFVWLEELIELVEKSASSELYGMLKRPDEKYVTEKAYDNPKFVEDLVRDIAVDLNQDDRISNYSVEAENFESIHNHSAYAKVNSK
ncbi:MAG: GTP cyclohydrolase FolE2 [Gammaproteobacteria bacterium]